MHMIAYLRFVISHCGWCFYLILNLCLPVTMIVVDTAVAAVVVTMIEVEIQEGKSYKVEEWSFLHYEYGLIHFKVRF